ncbi:hypothetical protein [Acinetobacter sp. ANC 4177]|uniref:hypothetical protein n=1 Tax=Acinetobacter sp. ANC 4177 TaxID=2529838 RepID=UPI00103CC7FE|nr:hypothetical protein [Acinetobacter sp. ANC 4177]TCB73929.1 hypothetical protein E0H91_11040 [Acinetobacter sp. ANC 4177]
MDIQKEKEAFLNVFQFFKSFKGIGFSEETEQFFLRKNKPNDAECLDVSNLNQMWRAWWARANAQVPEGFVLVPVKEIKTWYLDDSENMYREDPDWLCDIPIGEVVEVEHRVSYELDQDPVFVAIQWDEENGDVGYCETFKSKEEAEKVAAHCKAMKEAQEQGHD